MREAGASDRDAILDQLEYLTAELEAQAAVRRAVPDPLWAACPFPGERSLLEMYGIMAAREEGVFGDVCDAILNGVPSREPDEDELVALENWNDLGPSKVVERILEPRRRLVERLRLLPESFWERSAAVGATKMSLAGYTFRVTQQDADMLRRIGIRLYEAQLSNPHVRRL